MENVFEELKHYAHEVDLYTRYKWDFDGNFLNSIPQLGRFINGNFNNAFERNKALKIKLTEYFQQNPSDIEGLHFWIINVWGGIKNFKNTARNIRKIKDFQNEVKKGRLAGKTFSTISSLSKLSSFWDCKNFVIYDSRVIYSLNWLILKLSKEKKYFPTPAGRSEVIVKYNIDTIIRLFHKDKNQEEDLYFDAKEAYHRYCRLMKDWSLKLWDDKYSERQQYPFYLEMLLFVIANKEIYEDLKKSIKIEISLPNKKIRQVDNSHRKGETVMNFEEFLAWLSENLQNEHNFQTLAGRSHFHARYDPQNRVIAITLSTGYQGQLKENQIQRIFERYETGTQLERNMTSFYTDPSWRETPSRMLAPTIPAIIKSIVEEELR